MKLQLGSGKVSPVWNTAKLMFCKLGLKRATEVSVGTKRVGKTTSKYFFPKFLTSKRSSSTPTEVLVVVKMFSRWFCTP